jgi:predicted nuclease of predicted toxin-antitoxin system
MKLLFDQNLSARLVGLVADLYPASAHVRRLGMVTASDEAIWAYAGLHDFILVSKDVDFYHRGMRFGPPPKVIWIRAGNCTTDLVTRLLRDHHADIVAFVEAEGAAFLPLP